MEGERFLTQRTQRNAEKRRAAKSWKGTALTQRHSAAKCNQRGKSRRAVKKMEAKDFTAETQPTGAQNSDVEKLTKMQA